MRARKLSDILLVLAFCLCLVLPFAFADFEGGKSSPVENRFMAVAPRIFTENGLRLKNIKTNFEAWLDDNVGGRTQMVAANTWLHYALFCQSVHSNTLIGEESWIYYINDAILRDYQRSNLLSEDDLTAWVDGLRTVEDSLAAQGIPFLFSLAPDKKTVYPEYYPDTVLRLSDTTRSHQWAEAAQEAGLSFLLLEEVLVPEKENAPYGTVYSPRLDTSHWNANGALIAYEAIIGRAQKLVPGIPLLKAQRILPAEDSQGSQIEPDTEMTLASVPKSGLFQGVIPMREPGYKATILNPAKMRRDKDFFDGLDQLSYAGNPGEFALRLVNQDSNLPKLLLVGDSYYRLMLPYLKESFSEITFLHVADAEHLQTLVDKAQPDIVLVEIVERMVDMHFPRFLKLAETYRERT